MRAIRKRLRLGDFHSLIQITLNNTGRISGHISGFSWIPCNKGKQVLVNNGSRL